jgi:hypothetical protein
VKAGIAFIVLLAAGCTPVAHTGYEQSYLAARSNWKFRDRFPAVDHLFNGFDYGHAILYETLIDDRDAAERLEGPRFTFITQRLLKDPPRVPLEEAAIGPEYAKLIPEVVAMFDWAHMLHRQLYDVWAQYGRLQSEQDEQVARLIAYYKSRPDLAFSSHPKSMDLMEGQPYSLAFRREASKFNGLLWSYHWLQMALYEALMTGGTTEQVRTNVDTTVASFFAMLDAAPAHMPTEMPMSPGVAPTFSARYPEAAIIFDNLHALHDVVADILASDVIPRRAKRAAILAAAAKYRDDTTAVISVEEWRSMGRMMSGRR